MTYFSEHYDREVLSGKIKDGVALYCIRVLNGEIRACKKIHKACKRHVRDFKRQEDPKFAYRFDLEKADRPVRFAKKLKHWEGECAGKFFAPELWQIFLLGNLFGWVRKSDGLRRYRYAYVEVPRKNGKSFLASVISLYMLIVDREEGAQVYSVATKRDQAKIVWGSAVNIAKKSGLTNRGVSEHWLQMRFSPTNSRFEPLASDSDKLDGLNPHCVVCDELHEWPDRGLWDVLEDAFGARSQPLMFVITTAGFNRNSICYQQKTHGESILDGDEDGTYSDDTYFVFIADLDPDIVRLPDGSSKTFYDWKNEARWYEANPCLGSAKRIDYMRDQCNKATQMPGKENSFKNKQLDIWTEASEKWLDMERWDECGAAIDVSVLAGRACYAGLDLSSNTDLTASVYLFPPGPYEEWTVWPVFWMPAEGVAKKEKRDRVPYSLWIKSGFIQTTPGDMIDLDFIYQDILRQSARFKLRELGFDPWKAIEIATKLKNEGMEVIEMRQGHGTLGAPTRELEVKVSKRLLRHGGNPVLRWMAGNTVTIKDSNENIRPDKEKSPQRIDGIVALIMAIGRAQFGQGTHKTSVYEKRGPIVFGR